MPKFTSVDIELLSRDKTKPGIDKAKTGVKSLTRVIEEQFPRLGQLTNLVKAYWAEIGAAYLAVRKLTQFLQSCTAEWRKQESAVSAMELSLKNTGTYSRSMSIAIQQLASDLQKTTGIGDDTTVQMAGLLVAFGKLNREGLEKTLPLVQDLSLRLGMDFNSTAMLVGKTLGSTTNALSRYGFEVSKGASETEKLAQFIEWATRVAGGMSVEIGKTGEGIDKKFKAQISDLQETIGRFLDKAGNPFKEWLTRILIIINENFPKMERRIKQFGIVWGAVMEANRKIYQAFVAYAYATSKSITGIFDAFSLALQGRFKEAGEAIKGIGETWKAFGQGFKDSWSTYFEDTLGNLTEKLESAYGGPNKPISILDAHREALLKNKKALSDIGETMEETGGKAETFYGIMAEVTDMTYRSTGYYRGLNEELEDLWATTASGETYMGIMSDVIMSGGKSLEYMKKKTREADEGLKDFLAGTEMVFDIVDKASSTMYRNREIDLDNWYNKEKENIEATITDETAKEAALKTLDEQADSRRKKIARDEAVAKKRNAVFSIVIETARGIAEAFPKVWKMAMIAAAGAAQMAIVAAQKIPEYQLGGRVKKQQGGLQFGDTVPAMLEPGEAVIPRRTVQRNAAAINFMQTGGEFKITVPLYLDGRKIAQNTASHINRGHAQVDKKQVVNIA